MYALDVNGLKENSNVLAGNAALEHVAELSSSQTKPRTTSITLNGHPGGYTARNGGTTMEQARQGEYLNMAVRATDTQATMRELAEGTGGFLIADTQDLRKPFQRVVEEIDTHYEAVYHPASGNYDGRFRTIAVKLERPDLNVQSRTGYFALPALSNTGELTLSDMIGLAALNAPQPPHVFDFRTAAFQFRPTSEGAQQALAFELPAGFLAATALPDQKRHRVHVSLLALVKDSEGQVVEKISRDASFDIPDENLETMRKMTIPFTHLVELPVGRYTLETAVLDREANRASVGKLEIENPAAAGPGLSSVMLVQRLDPLEGPEDASDPFRYPVEKGGPRRVVPELASAISASEKPFVYFVVYPDKSAPESPKIEIEYLVQGQVVAKKTSDLPAPDATGAIAMMLKAATRPGNCELRITAVQGEASTTRTVTYTVAQ